MSESPLASYTITDDIPKSYNVVFAKWLRSFRQGNDYVKLASPAKYYEAYHIYIERILRSPKTTIRFAVLTEDRDVILGFSVFQSNILHYVHVQKEVRKQGIARSLIPPSIDTITHLTKTGLIIWSNKHPEWVFNPFAEL